MAIVSAIRPSVKAIRVFGEGVLPEFPPARSGSRVPSDTDRLWHLGFTLGRDGIEAAPLSLWSYDLQTSFLDGYGWGAVQRDADLDETFRDELEKAEAFAAEGGVL